MKKALRWFRDRIAEGRIRRRCQFSVGFRSKINFRNLGNSLPKIFHVGSGSIFQGRISADRPDAEIIIGDNTFVGNSHFVCAERIVVGNDVLISWGCTIVDHNSHAIYWSDRKNDVVDTLNGFKEWGSVKIAPTIICDKAWIGFGATILKGVKIGEGAVVGACSVVTKDVAPHTVVAGNPARLVRTLI